MNKLSVVIITFNEEKNIERCLLSVANIADEVVVVDSFSTDRTKDICLKYNARFIQNAFRGHIEQKNFAADQASYDWVLSLDADEALTDSLKEEIVRLKENFTHDGYYMKRLSSYCGHWVKHCGWYPDKKMRLWNRTKGSWGGENPHDKYSLREGCSVSFLKNDLLHYTFHTIEQHIDTIQKFSTIAATQRYKKGHKTNVFRILLKPFIKFIALYFFRLGILDGYYGFIICINSAFSAYLKEIKLYQIYRQNIK